LDALARAEGLEPGSHPTNQQVFERESQGATRIREWAPPDP
jgi:hypothetical protein